MFHALLALNIAAYVNDPAPAASDTVCDCVRVLEAETQVLLAVDLENTAHRIVFDPDKIDILGLKDDGQRFFDMVPGYTNRNGGYLGGSPMHEVAVVVDGVVMLPGTGF